jgi:hypothetical protein
VFDPDPDAAPFFLASLMLAVVVVVALVWG